MSKDKIKKPEGFSFGIVDTICVDYRYYLYTLLSLTAASSLYLLILDPKYQGESLTLLALCATMLAIVHFVQKQRDKEIARDIRRWTQLKKDEKKREDVIKRFRERNENMQKIKEKGAAWKKDKND